MYWIVYEKSHPYHHGRGGTPIYCIMKTLEVYFVNFFYFFFGVA